MPHVSEEERSDDSRLDEAVALPLLRSLREDPDWNGKRIHALLEVAWHTGARLGGLRALDLGDTHFEENYLDFRHRPETDTGLKNKSKGERPVAVPEEVTDVLERYVEHFRFDVSDDHGRQPLFASRRGRASKALLRGIMYQATQPCLYRACPHEKERETCEWTEYTQASKCPSSRSPHRIRTGSITWQLNIGMPPAVVAERVNATTQTIKQHYDKESPLREMEARRRPFVDEMDLEETEQEHDHDT